MCGDVCRSFQKCVEMTQNMTTESDHKIARNGM